MPTPTPTIPTLFGPEAYCGGFDTLPASAPAAPAPALAERLDIATNFGAYMPRIHCMQTAQGTPDWPWIFLLVAATAGIVFWYARIYAFWRRCYIAEEPRDRNKRMMDLANIFFWCAICGYGMSLLMFVWPAYRLLAIFLIVLNVWSWRFVRHKEEFRISLRAKRLERELRESLEVRNTELETVVAERTREAEAARAEAERANHAKSDFLAHISHEIRTPLNAIMGFADVLDDPNLADDTRSEHVGTIRRNSAHLLAVINDVLDLSKVEAGRMQVERIETDAALVARDVVEVLRARAAEKNINITLRFATPIPDRITTDPTHLKQVLLNLCSNAVKFTNEGSVTLELATDDEGFLVCRVIDTGIGLSDEQADRIFEPFTQAEHSTARQYGGTGLGLTISRSLAHALGGDLTATGTPGQGSTFTLRIDPGPAIPQQSSDAPASDTPAKPAEPLNPPTANLAGLRVLLAEDGPDNVRLLKAYLVRTGVDLHVAANGREALDSVRNNTARPFDLILMDVHMPEMDGLDATRLIRDAGCTTPILALTASALNSDRSVALDAGCDDFVTKPIGKDDFLSVVAQWTNRDDAHCAEDRPAA